MPKLAFCGCDYGKVAKKFLALPSGREVLVCEHCYLNNQPRWGVYTNVGRSRALWTNEDRAIIIELYDKGWSFAAIAKKMKVDKQIMRRWARDMGLSYRYRFKGGRDGVYSITELVELFGKWLSRTAVHNLIKRGDLVPTAARRRRYRVIYVSHDALWNFLENPIHWVRWEVEWITDPELRDHARRIRTTAPVRYMTLQEAGEILAFHPRTIMGWIEKGVLPAIRAGSKGSQYQVRSDHIATIQKHLDLLPTCGDKQRVGRNRDALIAQLRSLLAA